MPDVKPLQSESSGSELLQNERIVFRPGMLKSCCLSTAYLPPVEYVALWMHAERCCIEGYEYYEKQSYRNRCRIASASGMMELSIPVERSSGNRTLTRDVRLSDHGNWRHQHWKAIEAAYQSGPFFDYLADDLQQLYAQPYSFLMDFNERFLGIIAEWLEIKQLPDNTAHFGDYQQDTLVLRTVVHPKKRQLIDMPSPYYQVFSTKNGFIPGLSILDLLMNCGKESILYLNTFKNRDFSVFL